MMPAFPKGLDQATTRGGAPCAPFDSANHPLDQAAAYLKVSCFAREAGIRTLSTSRYSKKRFSVLTQTQTHRCLQRLEQQAPLEVLKSVIRDMHGESDDGDEANAAAEAALVMSFMRFSNKV